MSHRLIVHWNQWLTKGLGELVLQAEQEALEAFLTGIYGKHAILVGVPAQQKLLKPLLPPCHLLLTPLSHSDKGIMAIESNLYELPLASGSVDLVILPHTLELVDNPRQLLAEACRIIKPEGHLVICGFNPFSLWGLKRALSRAKTAFNGLHFLQESKIKKWLDLSDFELMQEASILYAPPIDNQALAKKLRFMEWLGNKCHLPGGALYVLMAKAKVIPLTPIRWRWKQSLASVRISSSIPGPTIRNSK